MPATDILDGYFQQPTATDEPGEAGEVPTAITLQRAQRLHHAQTDRKEAMLELLPLPVASLKQTNVVTLGIKAADSNEEMIKIYQDNIRQFGFQPRTLLYPNDELHEAKVNQHYDILSQLISSGEIGVNDSLLDVGCGYGSLAGKLETLLEEVGHVGENISYKGIDIVPEFIDYAEKTYNGRGFLFQEMDLEHYMGQEDWCILLGVVNSVPDPDKLVSLAMSKCCKGMLVDFNDQEKIPYTSFHKFDIDEQIKRLYEAGAKHVDRCLGHLPNYPWTILLVRK